MEHQAINERWQVEVGGQVYDATFAELGQWVDEGALQPDDKVRKGNLRWIEARKVPGLLPFFNAKARGEAIPIVVTSVFAEETSTASAVNGVELLTEEAVPVENHTSQIPAAAGITVGFQPQSDPNFCAFHDGVESVFLCDGCCSGFCKSCPKSYGGTVKVCPVCGSMCRPVSEVREKVEQLNQISAAVNEGFGLSDFTRAVAFPFKFKASLFFGAVMFAIFSISQSATAVGGIVMFASAIVCFMLANMLTFGVLANTVQNFTQGALEANFMPTFDDFSLWDDVVHPFFLSIGVYLSSFGPFALVFLIGTYLVVSSVSSQMNSFQSEVERLPGTHYYQGRDTVEQSQEIKRVLGETVEEHNETIGEYNEAAIGNSNVAITEPTPDDAEELWRMAQEGRKKELEAVFGKTKETQDKEFGEFTTNLLQLAAPLVVIGGITFLWGMFFFPAACAVAGYTRSFMATINPLIGLDTIKRLGADYVKILLMGFGLLIVSGFFGAFFGFILSPLDLPGMGNVVAKGFSSMVTFYLSVVFACIIGYALFKNADKLHLLR
jgi:hypothetical protein